MKELQECKIVERFLGQADDDSFTAVFQVFWPQLVGFFRSA
jgi:hypothetical protein